MRNLAVAALLALAACSSRSPDQAYKAFLKAAADKDADAAWKLLSSRAQAELTTRAKAAAGASGGVVSDDPRAYLFGDAQPQRPDAVKNVLVLRESGGRAVLKVEDSSGESREVAMVKEKGGWRVDADFGK